MGKGFPLAVLGAIVAGVYLLSDPHCKHGCRTVAKHLLTYGLEGLMS